MKKKYIIFFIYLVIFGLMCLTSNVLAKYISNNESDYPFTAGDILYFNYERSNVYKNDLLIQDIYSNEDVQEVISVAPADTLVYYFYVSNFNSKTGEVNAVDGIIFPYTYVELSLPEIGQTQTVECVIEYREVPYDRTDNLTENNQAWTTLTDGNYLALPTVADTKIKYEFRATFTLSEQVMNTSHEDYANATALIQIFVNATCN